MSLDGLLSECISMGLCRPMRQQEGAGLSILQAAMRPGSIDPLPWRLGLNLDTSNLMTWAGAAPPVPAAEPSPAPKPEVPRAISEAVAPKITQPQQTSSRLAPSAEDAADKARVIEAWRVILNKLGTNTDAYDQCGGNIEAKHISTLFGGKATGTMANHASAWSLFIKFTEAYELPLSDFGEEQVFHYLSTLNSGLVKSSPSRPLSFLKAINFLRGCCGLKMGFQVTSSGRCRGAAVVSIAEVRLAKQRDPLRSNWLISAEEEIVLADEGNGSLGRLSTSEAVMLGFLVFCVHARIRCSDASRVRLEPVLDEAADSDPISSFVEASSTGAATKTGQTAKRARLSVPMVALSRGLSDLPWAKSWLSLRANAGLNASEDECLQRELLANGTFGAGRVKPGQATDWLRRLLLKLGVEAAGLSNVGSHSCKATLLSMAAKGGLSRDDRRTLGNHVAPNDRSVDIYSRDVMAAPLRNLALLLKQVRDGAFEPDASRSGRWWRHPSQDRCPSCEDPLSAAVAFRCPCGRSVHSYCAAKCQTCLAEFCQLCEEYVTHVCREPETVAQELLEESGSDWDTDDDSDLELARMTLEQAEEEEVEEAQEKAFLTKGASADNALVPEDGLYVHMVHGTAHKATKEGTTACGVIVSDITHEYLTEADDISHVRLCWRSGCAPWVRTEAAAASKENIEVSSSSDSEAEQVEADDGF